MTTSAPARQFVSVEKAAEYADVHPITIRRWITAGRLVAHRMGPRLIKVDLHELEAMLKPVDSKHNEAAASDEPDEYATRIAQQLAELQRLSCEVQDLMAELRAVRSAS